MSDIHEEFKAGAEAYAQRLREDRERRDNPRKSRADNADAFTAHVESILAARREENGL